MTDTDTKFIHGNDPNDPSLLNPLRPLREGWDMRRGKVTPKAPASWGMKDANGRGVDYDAARKILDEAER